MPDGRCRKEGRKIGGKDGWEDERKKEKKKRRKEGLSFLRYISFLLCWMIGGRWGEKIQKEIKDFYFYIPLP
jgi:hypothetical protein